MGQKEKASQAGALRGFRTVDDTVSDMEGQSVYYHIQPEPLFGSILYEPKENVFYGLVCFNSLAISSPTSG